MSKRFYIGGSMSMLGMAILVPLILQEPLPAISGESFGPAVSGKLDSTPRPDVFPDAPRNVQPDIRQSVRPEALPQDVPTGEERGEQAGAMPPLPPREAMTMSVEATHPVSGQTEASSVPAEKSTAKNAAPGAVSTPEALRPAPAVTVPSSSEKNPGESPRTTPKRTDPQKGSAAAEKTTGAEKNTGGAERKADVQERKPGTSGQNAAGRNAPRVRPGTIVTRGTLPAQSGKQVVTSSTLTMDGDVVTLRLEANSPIKGKSFILASPDRVVLDLSGSWKLAAPRVPSNRMLRELRVGAREDGIRLVFDMRVKPSSATVKQISSKVLELRIR